MGIILPRRSHGFGDPCVEGPALVSRPHRRSLIGMLLAAAFPIASPAFAEVQPADRPAPPAQTAPSPPSLGSSITGPLHYHSNPLHVDGGPLGPVYISGVISGLGFVQGHYSLTLTPTRQSGIFFARAEGSYVHAHGVVDGFGLGQDLDQHSEVRGLIEAGIIF